MGQNSSRTLHGVNKLNIDASDSYVTEIGMGLKKGAIPISDIIKMEKYNKLKHKLHVNPKKKYHRVVVHEKPNVKDTNYRNEMRQNNLPVKHDEIIKNYPRMRSGGQNYNNQEQPNRLEKDLHKEKSPTRKEDVKEVYKNNDYLEKNNKKKYQNKSLQRKSSNENHAMKTVTNKTVDKREELSKQQEEEDKKQQKCDKFVMETNVSCIVPPKYVYYDEFASRKDQNMENFCQNSKCPCKRHECPYLQKQKHQFASITALSQEDIRFRRFQENQFRRHAPLHDTCEFGNKMDPRERRQQYASNVSISEENLRGRDCRERQFRRNRDDEERRCQERRYDTYPNKRGEENKIVSPKEALENWKNMHTLRNQSKLKEQREMLNSNDESNHKYGKHDVRNRSPTVHKIWPPNHKCCMRRTSSMMSVQAKDGRYREGIHADLERCLLQHANRNSKCRENDYRYSKSTWVQDRHRKWHKVMVND